MKQKLMQRLAVFRVLGFSKSTLFTIGLITGLAAGLISCGGGCG